MINKINYYILDLQYKALKKDSNNIYKIDINWMINFINI